MTTSITAIDPLYREELMGLTVNQFMERLEQISAHQGVPYARAYRIFDAEEVYANEAIKYKGQLALSDAFKCLYLETVELLNTECRPKAARPLLDHYPAFVLQLTHGFQSLCGAERLAFRGYPYQGYTLLRNTFDTLVLISAALQGLTDFHRLEGLEEAKEFDPRTARRLRIKTEQKVKQLMTGSQSGLSQDTVRALSEWDALFDYEVHGGRLSRATQQAWLAGKAPLSVLPTFLEQPLAMFMNRYSEVAWMHHRLLSSIQPPGLPLPDSWANKWQVLDECFHFAVYSLTEQLGKSIGAALTEFVHNKFPFTAQTQFPN